MLCASKECEGEYYVPAEDNTSTMNYVYAMEEEEGLKKGDMDEQSPVLVTAT